MAKYVPVKDLDELLSARAAGLLWFDGDPERDEIPELVQWWEIAVQNVAKGWVGTGYLLPDLWTVLVEDDGEGSG